MYESKTYLEASSHVKSLCCAANKLRGPFVQCSTAVKCTLLHRRRQGERESCSTKIFSKPCNFVFWEAVSETKYRIAIRIKLKDLSPPKKFGLAALLLCWVFTAYQFVSVNYGSSTQNACVLPTAMLTEFCVASPVKYSRCFPKSSYPFRQNIWHLNYKQFICLCWTMCIFTQLFYPFISIVRCIL